MGIADVRTEDALNFHIEALDIRKEFLGDTLVTAASYYKVGTLMPKCGHIEKAMFVSPALISLSLLTFDSDHLISSILIYSSTQGNPTHRRFLGVRAASAWHLHRCMTSLERHHNASAFLRVACSIREMLVYEPKVQLEDADFEHMIQWNVLVS